jgi:hypothetical protein
MLEFLWLAGQRPTSQGVPPTFLPALMIPCWPLLDRSRRVLECLVPVHRQSLSRFFRSGVKVSSHFFRVASERQ